MEVVSQRAAVESRKVRSMLTLIHPLSAPSAYSLFLVQRATSFALSLILGKPSRQATLSGSSTNTRADLSDYSAYALLSPTTRSSSQRYKLLCLLGSSHALLSLCTRPFSNGIEAALVGLVLVLTRNVLRITYQWVSHCELCSVALSVCVRLCADGQSTLAGPKVRIRKGTIAPKVV